MIIIILRLFSPLLKDPGDLCALHDTKTTKQLMKIVLKNPILNIRATFRQGSQGKGSSTV